MTETGSTTSLTVVGLGASAGGLQALQQVLAGLPDELDAALVVIQHLSPDFETRMDELLAAYTKLPIRRATNEMILERSTIYLMPPKVEMIVSGGRLLLSERMADHGLWLPIDSFFRSMSEDVGPHAVGVVLSGTGSDGSRGLRAIHEAGGLALVQEPTTARFDGMPRSAIDTGVADLVLTPDKIGEAIACYVQRANRDDLPFVADAEREGLDGVFEVLEREGGIDFGVYKANTIRRRLDRRLLMTGTSDVDAYLAVLREDPLEREALYRDLLIGVTSFFRDPEAFALIERDILPELVRNLPEGDALRVWVAACATGEEAYSIAISVLETFRRLGRKPRLRIFATDVHRGSIETASTGAYDDEQLAGIEPDVRDRYFHREGARFRVTEELRNTVVFAYHNVLRDAPFTKLDLVTCRNLLIYFDQQAQRRVLALFHFALKTSGVLFLGPSETPGALADELGAIDRRWKLYRKRRELRLPPELRSVTQLRPLIRPAPSRGDDDVERARQALLERFAPPALLVSTDYTLIHSSGGASRFLSHRDGTPSLSLLDMVGGELKYAFAGAFKRVREGAANTQVRYEGVPAETTEGPVRLAVTVSRLGAEGDPFLVTLDPRPAQEPGPEPARDVPIDDLARERIESLELELRYAKENLQATIEEMEASNEELQATNEELIASNEELHSANEELQSVNEELYTVNAEHQQKITELQQLTTDMEHLFQATDVHTVFLDEELRIRKFTPKMAETFHLIQADEGRSIDTFSHRLRHPTLHRELRQVLSAGVRIEVEVEDLDGRCYLMRILPYRPRERVEGVVFTLIDVSGMKRTERELREREAQIAAILEHSPVPIYARSAKGELLMAGRQTRELFGIDDREPSRVSADERHVIETGETVVREETRTVAGQERTFLVVRFPVGREGSADAVAAIANDITDRKLHEERQRQAVEQRDHFLAMLSHELRNPLAAIGTAAQIIRESEQPALREVANALARQTDHVKDLLDDLLDVNRMTLDRLVFRKRKVSLRQIIARTTETVQAMAEPRGVVLELPEVVPDRVLAGDLSRLQQMLTNVMVNGVKFSPRGGTLSLEVMDGPAHVTLRVRDQGVGLDSSELERVFELFYQERQDIARSGGGLGVGLSLARTIVQAHGGTICARSEGRGKGACFEIVLPWPSEEELAALEDAPSAPVQAEAPPLDVVLVEDQQDNRDMLSMFVALHGHRAVAVAEGEEAIATILRARPDVALIDIGLPGMDGYEVARRIRALEDGRSLYLVALTGYGRPEDRENARAAGFDDHVVKPMSRAELARVLATAADRRARHAQA